MLSWQKEDKSIRQIVRKGHVSALGASHHNNSALKYV